MPRKRRKPWIRSATLAFDVAPTVLLSLELSHARSEIAKFGGRPDLAATEKSLYPYFFSPADEAGIVNRLN